MICYESAIDEENIDENSNDMMETNRFVDDDALKESRKQNTDGRQSHQEKQLKPYKANLAEIVNE